MSGIAERAGGAVAISDGRRLLRRGGDRAPPGGGDDLAALQAGDRRARAGAGHARRRDGGRAAAAGRAARAGRRRRARFRGARGLPLPWPALAILMHRRGVRDRALHHPVAARVRRARSRRWCRRPMARRVAMIGRYTIVERIGQGGMADIYAAVTQGEGSFRRPVVIKRLRPELSIDPNAVAQFCDEANLLAALHHPNIIAVHDFGRSQGQYFLAEEYVVGRDLGRLVSAPLRSGAPPAARRGHRLRRRRGAEGARVRARPDQRDGSAAGHRAPRRLARELDGVGARRGEAARLRRRQGVGGAADAAPRSASSRATSRTWRRNRRAGWRSMRAPTCIRWRWCSTRWRRDGRCMSGTRPMAS